MILKVEADLGSADEQEQEQLAEHLLRRARVRVTQEVRPLERDRDDPIILRDINGNRVGAAWFEEE